MNFFLCALCSSFLPVRGENKKTALREGGLFESPDATFYATPPSKAKAPGLLDKKWAADDVYAGRQLR